MSSNKRIKKEDPPKIPPKAVMQTRYKSSQEKRRLRDKDRSKMKMLTQLIKGTPPSPKETRSPKEPTNHKSPRKPKTPIGSQITKLESVDLETEYYPNKLKREILSKKIVLKPKPNLKLLVPHGSSKRKFIVPQKGSKSPQTTQIPNKSAKRKQSLLKPKWDDSIQYAELSMYEVIRIKEEADGLDDDDLMEILTCPSPVWWEEPPDEWHIEEPITTCLPTNQLNKKSTEKPSVKTDDRFLKKQSKLEQLLGNIKKKLPNTDVVSPVIDNLDVNIPSNHVNIPNNEVNIPGNDVNIPSNDVDIPREDVIDKVSENDNDERVTDNDFDKKSSRTSESSEFFCDDELLNHLENIQIPIEKPRENSTSFDCIIMDDNVNNIPKLKVKTQNAAADDKTVKVDDDLVLPDMPPLQKRPDIHVKKAFSSPISIKSVTSSDDILDSHSIVSSHDNYDTISDTNIRFITDDEIDSDSIKNVDLNNLVEADNDEVDVDQLNNDERTQNEKPNTIKDDDVKVVTDKDCDTQSVIENKGDSTEYVTVYKILHKSELNEVSEEKSESLDSKEKQNKTVQSINITESVTSEGTKSDKDNTRNAKMNDFFKKCKNVYLQITKNKSKLYENAKIVDSNESSVDSDAVDIDEQRSNPEDGKRRNTDDPSTILVSEDKNVKYCLKCSCIFDNNSCEYCAKKLKSNEGNTKTLTIKLETSSINS